MARLKKWSERARLLLVAGWPVHAHIVQESILTEEEVMSRHRTTERLEALPSVRLVG